MTIPRILKRLDLIAVLAGAAHLLWSYGTAVREPKVRHTRVAAAGWPSGTPPLRLVLISDVHVGGPDMPPARVRRIVDQINRLRPDIVLIAGDWSR